MLEIQVMVTFAEICWEKKKRFTATIVLLPLTDMSLTEVGYISVFGDNLDSQNTEGKNDFDKLNNF